LKAHSIRGTVFSGKAEGAKYAKLPWARKQITEKVGFTPYPGTLNIRLTDEDAMKLREILDMTKPIEILPATGYCRGRCFKARLEGNLACAVVIPEVTDYPKNVIELIAPLNLRKTLHADDGDTIEVKIVL
jgi:riboflavin kinase